MRIDILSLFPGYFAGPFQESMIGRARESGLLDLRLVDIRDYAEGKHRPVDDRAYGGGPGMVLMAEPVAKAIRAAKWSEATRSRVIFLTPQGATLTAKRCRELAEYDHLILLCGHYEGVDQRVLDSEIEEEVSIGDYVLTNGCLSAIVLVDAVVRFIPGVIGHEDAAREDSFEKDLLDCPHYTRPDVWEGLKVPDLLLQGNHEAIAQWRRGRSLAKTAEVRPDLFMQHLLAHEQSSMGQQVKRKPKVCGAKPPEEIGLMVRNISLSRRFYRDQLGFRPVFEADDSLVLALGGQALRLIQGEVKQAVVQFQVTESDSYQLQQLARTANGYEVEPGPEGPKIVKVWFIDPDGYRWVVILGESDHE